MIFGQDYIIMEILDVLFIEQENIKTYNKNRCFSALSYRYQGEETVIDPSVAVPSDATDENIYSDKEKYNKQIDLSDNSICYFPSSVDYIRTSKKDKLIVIHFKLFNYHSNEIEPFYPDDYEKYRKLFEEILLCWEEKKVDYLYKSTAILYEIFAELYKDNQILYKPNSVIYNSIRYIEENYFKKDFSIAKASQKSFISDAYFRRLFKKEFGLSPKKYVINKRLKYASALIMTGYYSMKEISDMCGYPDYRHFSTEFKKHLGVSPSSYTYNYTNSFTFY